MKFLKGKLSKISCIAAALFLLGFVFISIFGMSLSMQMRGDGTMDSCPLMGNTATLCSMTTSEHLNLWQRLFSAVPAGKVLAVMVVLFAAYLFLLLGDRLNQRPNPLALWRESYKQEHPDSKLFNYLIAFFARGILQPKLYA